MPQQNMESLAFSYAYMGIDCIEYLYAYASITCIELKTEKNILKNSENFIPRCFPFLRTCFGVHVYTNTSIE